MAHQQHYGSSAALQVYIIAVKMGGIVQRATQDPQQRTPLAKSTAAALQGLQIVRTSPVGHVVERGNQLGEALLASRRIPLVLYHSQKQAIANWLQSTSKHSCNVLLYILEDESYFCSSHVNFKALVEHSDCSLASMLTQQKGFELAEQQLSRKEAVWSTPLSILNLVKFLIQATEEHQESIGGWPTYHTTNVLYFSPEKQFKFLYIPQFDQSQEHESFFDPEHEHEKLSKTCQHTTVFSIGMVLVSLMLRQDCSDCYDYRHFHFCRSAFEDKLQQLQALHNKPLIVSQLSCSNCGPTLDEQLIDFALALTSPRTQRPTFPQLKSKYFKMLRKISANCESASCATTKRKEVAGSRMLEGRRGRVELRPFEARDMREKEVKRRENSETDDTFELVDQLSKKRKGKGSGIKRDVRQRRREENKENSGQLQYG